MNRGNFPETQEGTEIELLSGHKLLYSGDEVDAWAILPGGWNSGGIPDTYEIDIKGKIALREEVKLRSEEFGGLAYNKGLVIGLNRPAYDIIKKLKVAAMKVAEIPEHFITQLTQYGMIVNA